jgi:DNA-binding response OmpR family regulator
MWERDAPSTQHAERHAAVDAHARHSHAGEVGTRSAEFRILLVDDSDSGESEFLEPLSAAGFEVIRARRGRTALELVEREGCDLVLLDGQPAGMSGFQVCQALRRVTTVPIIFLSSEAALAERLLAFDLGADDFIQRPAAPEEVERRVRAVLRRSMPVDHTRQTLLGPHGLRLSLVEHTVRVRETPIMVTAKEFEVLRVLLERRGEVLETDAISLAVWGYETMGSRNFVEAHVSRLRSKLGQAGAPGVIETVRSVGYVIR